MRKNLLLFLLVFAAACGHGQKSDGYTYRKGSPDGIGKWYMGREIAWVMGHQGISWLERGSREEEENSSLLLSLLSIKQGDIIADIGAGSGYYSRRMAAIAGPKGRVLAVDIQPEMLDWISRQPVPGGAAPIDTVLCTESSLPLSSESVDKMLLVDVYHEMAFPREMAREMHRVLKPGGLLYLVEYKGEDPEIPIKPLHKMTVKQAVAEMRAAGFELRRAETSLPIQHLLCFGKATGR